MSRTSESQPDEPVSASHLRDVPVLPLREAVLLPAVASPIGVGRPATLKAVEAALADPDKKVFVVAQRDNVDEVTPDGLYRVGTLARIGKIHRISGGMQLLVEGERRAFAVRYTERGGYLHALVREAREGLPADPSDPAFQALQREVRDRTRELGRKAGLPEEVVNEILADVEEPGRLADVVANYLDLELAERQMLLETLPVEERLRLVLVQVERQIAVVAAQQEIKSKVQQELGDRQREMVLREQLKAIQNELGEGEEADETDELRRKLESLDLPPAARKEVDRELKRLGRVSRETMEAQIIRTYLETVAELPWTVRSDERLDLKSAAKVLDEDHYGLEDVKDRVLEFLAVRQLREARRQAEAQRGRETASDSGDAPPADGGPEGQEPGGAQDGAPGNPDDRVSRGPILLFVGPPGVGKTSIARSIARAMGRKYVRMSLGGARDEADIRGHRRTYVGAMPGRILQGMKEAGTKNPVFLLDEVDKLGVSFQGDPAAALLEVLDPAQNHTFVDHYLGIPFDLSEVLFIATANFLQHIPAPLLDRMEKVEFSGYTEKEKLEIARRYLLPRQLRENALDESQLEIADEAVSKVIAGYTRESGVRQLERELGRLARKVARRIAAREVGRAAVEAADVAELLGRPKVHPERASMEDQVGVATGMYYTPTGGDIMFVEATTMRGKGELVLTGHLGDVMKESARAAWSYARSHAGGLRIPEEQFERDVHVHVPAGAIPKDGPSAGVSMATALVSALSARPVRHDIAMTGEITLSGRVLPIGGVKEKVLGAERAGITRIVLPKENEADLEDLPAEVRQRLEVHLVEELGEALALALRGGSYREGRLLFGDDRPEDVHPLHGPIQN